MEDLTIDFIKSYEYNKGERGTSRKQRNITKAMRKPPANIASKLSEQHREPPKDGTATTVQMVVLFCVRIPKK